MEYTFFHFPYLDSLETFLSSCSLNISLTLTCSDVIETVVHNESWNGSPIRESPFCSFCNMIVLWIQVQIKQSNVKEKVFKYVDEVVVDRLTAVRNASHHICLQLITHKLFLCVNFLA